MKYAVVIAPAATSALKQIRDRRVRQQLDWKIAGLAHDPDRQGKSLGQELVGYRSVRAAGQRFRIVYRVHAHTVEVLIVAVGLRSEGSRDDVYEQFKRWLRKQ